MRIFVTVGTAVDPFNRLITAVDEALDAAHSPFSGVCQFGACSVRSRRLKNVMSLPRQAFELEVSRAEVIVCHGGVGTLQAAVRHGHRPYVMVREAAHSEAVNDHQGELVELLERRGLVRRFRSAAELASLLERHPPRRRLPRSRSPLTEMLNGALRPMAESQPRSRVKDAVLRILALAAGRDTQPRTFSGPTESISRCPLCASPARRPWLTSHNIDLVICNECGHRYGSQVLPSERLRNQYYDEPLKALADRGGGMAVRRTFEEYRRAFPELFTNPGSVLDVGCNTGELLSNFKRCGWKVQGIEPSAGPAHVARSRLGSSIWAVAVEEFDHDLGEFDLITMIHVLEHLTDPVGTLSALRSHVAPTGALLLEVPNVDDPLLRVFRGYYRPLCAGDHVSFFDLKSLSSALTLSGWRIEAVTSPFRGSQVINGAALSIADYLGAVCRRAPFSACGVERQIRYRGTFRGPVKRVVESTLESIDPYMVWLHGLAVRSPNEGSVICVHAVPRKE